MFFAQRRLMLNKFSMVRKLSVRLLTLLHHHFSFHIAEALILPLDFQDPHHISILGKVKKFFFQRAPLIQTLILQLGCLIATLKFLLVYQQARLRYAHKAEPLLLFMEKRGQNTRLLFQESTEFREITSFQCSVPRGKSLIVGVCSFFKERKRKVVLSFIEMCIAR
mmetsp:Transcript_30206/g.36752  ORF Transcript_30206/g.36752 Transcript_30206/m.36752 type:complete len:166 (+) Transcript_30206:1819-2316(+)